MTSNDVVVRLNQELSGTRVLSVYLNAEETDFGARRAWRIRLKGMLKELEEALRTVPEELAAARQAAARIEEELNAFAGLLPGRGWIGFATADRVWHSASSAAPMPDLVRWEDGAHVAPYMRALKQARPVTAIVADRRHARVLRYLQGELREDQVLWSDAAQADGPAAGGSKRASTHSGVRGEPRSDAVRRSEEASTQRMLRDVAGVLAAAAKNGHLLMLAGSSEITASLLAELDDRARVRAAELPGLRPDASMAELKAAIDGAASELSGRLQGALVQEILDATRADGRGCTGRERTERALEAGAVDTLVLSRGFAREEPDLAERLVDRALEQGAEVEEIAEGAAAELDREGGIAARLRFAA